MSQESLSCYCGRPPPHLSLTPTVPAQGSARQPHRGLPSGAGHPLSRSARPDYAGAQHTEQLPLCPTLLVLWNRPCSSPYFCFCHNLHPFNTQFMARRWKMVRIAKICGKVKWFRHHCYFIIPWILFCSQWIEHVDVHSVKLGARFHYVRFKVIKYLFL